MQTQKYGVLATIKKVTNKPIQHTTKKATSVEFINISNKQNQVI